MKNRITLLFILMAVLFGCKPKHEPTLKNVADNRTVSNDTIIKDAAKGGVIYDTTREAGYLVDSYSNGLFSIEAAQVVKQKTQIPEVKEFADKIVSLQSKKVEEFENVAKTKKISLPSNLSLIQRYELKGITEKDPGELEKVFIEKIESKNKEDIALLEKISKESEDNDIATLAISSLATVKYQSDEIKSVKERFEL
jgi:predicted outer membrane protein